MNQKWIDSKHEWETEGNEINMFAYEEGDYCNGPKCIKCGYSGCWHCNDEPPKCEG